ncbi:MAG TPA: SoxS [Rhodobacteraceae bacterium]|nr:SoxS [Paracoccaceae bacterium]
MNVLLLVAGTGLASPVAAGELRLLMFDQPGCVYCARWKAEIGPIYPVTEEATAAPLTTVDIDDALPGGVALARPVTLTPTFVLLDDGAEAGRLEGYPGEDFFWFLLGELIEDAREPDS